MSGERIGHMTNEEFSAFGTAMQQMSATAKELCRARAKFPGTDCLFSALSEEMGELARELDKPTAEIDWDRVEAEARQVACVATRIATERFDPETEDHLVYAAAKIGENLARRHMAALEEEGRSGS